MAAPARRAVRAPAAVAAAASTVTTSTSGSTRAWNSPAPEQCATTATATAQ